MRSNWIRCGTVVIVFAATPAAAMQQQGTQTRRQPQFENQHVRLWKSIVLPNQPLALHRSRSRPHDRCPERGRRTQDCQSHGQF